MKSKKKLQKSIAAAFVALIVALGIFGMVSPAQAQVTSVLYAGGSNPGYVYKYAGGTTWDVISPDLGFAVLDLVEYDGHLYAGIKSSSSFPSVGRVYRYDGGTTWTLVGDNMDHQVASLAVYNGDLYAGTGWNGMKLYKYGGGTTWTQVIASVVWSGTRSLYVSHGYLLMGDLGFDRFGRWDGTTFFQDQPVATGSCVYDYADYNGKVYASVYAGRMWQSPDAKTWSTLLDYYDGHMWELETFQDELYMSYDNGELRKSNVPDRGTLLYTAPDGIISMTTDGNNLYFGTGGEGGYNNEITGIAGVYKYNGATVELISGADEMVTGVQVLYSPPKPSKVTGWGLIGPKANPEKKFKIFANSNFTPKGVVEVTDYANGKTIKSSDISSVLTNNVSTPKTGTIKGFATVNGAGPYPFTVNVWDAADPSGGLDVFQILIPAISYSNKGNVSFGDVQVVK